MSAPYPGQPLRPGMPSDIPAVDAAIAALTEVAEAPPAEQVAPLVEAHRVLRETLDSIGDV